MLSPGNNDSAGHRCVQNGLKHVLDGVYECREMSIAQRWLAINSPRASCCIGKHLSSIIALVVTAEPESCNHGNVVNVHMGWPAWLLTFPWCYANIYAFNR